MVDGRVEWVEKEEDEREIGHGDVGSGWSDGTSVPEAVSSGASTTSKDSTASTDRTDRTAAEGVRKAGFAECDALWVRDDIPIVPESRPPVDRGEWTGLLMWAEEAKDGKGTGTERAKDIAQCRLWRSEYKVEVMVSWGTLPAPLQTSWGSKGCDGLSRSDAELSVILAGAAGASEFWAAGAADVSCSDNFVVTLGANIASPALTYSSVFEEVANVGLCCAKCQANEECHSFVLGPDRRCMLKYMTNKPDTSPRHSGMVSLCLSI